MEPAGRAWCARYPTGRTTATLKSPFRVGVQRFILALEDAGALVHITCTSRPEQRAYLMHWCWVLAHGLVNLANTPHREDIPIEWTLEGAKEMCAEYGLVFEPSLTSKHIPDVGLAEAIDMTIAFPHRAVVRYSSGAATTVEAGDGDVDPHVWEIGRSYGVVKFEDRDNKGASVQKDHPHWSAHGH